MAQLHLPTVVPSAYSLTLANNRPAPAYRAYRVAIGIIDAYMATHSRHAGSTALHTQPQSAICHAGQ